MRTNFHPSFPLGSIDELVTDGSTYPRGPMGTIAQSDAGHHVFPESWAIVKDDEDYEEWTIAELCEGTNPFKSSCDHVALFTCPCDRDEELWAEGNDQEIVERKSRTNDYVVEVRGNLPHVVAELIGMMDAESAAASLPSLAARVNMLKREDREPEQVELLTLVIKRLRNLVYYSTGAAADKDLIESAKREAREGFIATRAEGRKILGRRERETVKPARPARKSVEEYREEWRAINATHRETRDNYAATMRRIASRG